MGYLSSTAWLLIALILIASLTASAEATYRYTRHKRTATRTATSSVPANLQRSSLSLGGRSTPVGSELQAPASNGVGSWRARPRPPLKHVQTSREVNIAAERLQEEEKAPKEQREGLKQGAAGMPLLPLVYVHFGACDSGKASYMKSSLLLSAKYNSDVVMLSSPQCKVNVPPGVRHENLQQYTNERMRHFERQLFFGGRNGGGEAMCFSRFMVLLEYMKQHGVKRAAYADNDVAVTSNLTAADSALFSDKEMAVMWFPPLVSGHLSIFGQDGLEDFVGFFESLFTDGVWKGHASVVQDMQAFRYYVHKNLPHPWECWGLQGGAKGTCHDTDELRAMFLERIKRIPKFTNIGNLGSLHHFQGETVSWDNHLSHDPEKDMFVSLGGPLYGAKRGIKLTAWHGGNPYWKRRDVGIVRAGSLHFQGDKKPMEEQWVRQGLAADPKRWCWCLDRSCAPMTCQDNPP